MLSRTAEQLFWMARHMERAENTARMLDVTLRMMLLPNPTSEQTPPWAAPWAVPLITTGLATSYYAKYAKLAADDVLRFLVSDPGNASSIVSCLSAARENARTVRGTITSEMWESINATWLEVRSMDPASMRRDNVGEFFDWVKLRSHMFRGVSVGTALRDEAFQFNRLGTFLERADNTARFLDVKYHILLPTPQDVGGAQDYYQWSAVLRSVSAFEAYRKIYRDVVTPKKVAELLILRDDMPRSLHACMNELYTILENIGGDASREPERMAGELHARLHYARIDDVLRAGLHEYLLDFLDRIGDLGNEISDSFFSGQAGEPVDVD
jgi:uncharacterized alpha-E superfamily protein